MRFSPDSACLSTEGIPVSVDSIYDYGNGKYALCTVKIEKSAENKNGTLEVVDKKIFVAVSDEQQTGDAMLDLDISKVGVYDLEQDIKLK